MLATPSKIWGTGLSVFVTERTSQEYWTGKNLLGAMLTDLAQQLSSVESEVSQPMDGVLTDVDHVSEESADLHLTSASSEHCRAPSPSPASRSPPSQHSPPSPSQQTDNMQEKEKSLVQSTDDSANHLTDQSLSHPTQQPNNQPSAISLPANPYDHPVIVACSS